MNIYKLLDLNILNLIYVIRFKLFNKRSYCVFENFHFSFSHYIYFMCKVWKIQCKLPPKTKRFYPLKTFNNAPLKSLDRWGYYYFRFSSVRLNRLRNKLLANYLKSGGNELATVRISAFCVAMLSNNSFICKYSIFFRKYELSAAVL